MKKKIGIIFADSMEYAPFEKAVQQYKHEKLTALGNECIRFTLSEGEKEIEVTGMKCGIGKANAASAAAYFIGTEKTDFILNAGLSGAVSKCKREDLLIGDSYVECDFDLTAIGFKLGFKPEEGDCVIEADETLLSLAKMSEGLLVGRLGTGDLFLTNHEKKKLFRDLFGINAFDMETGAIAGICRKCKMPFLSIRKISDDADDTSKDTYTEMNNRQEACLTEVLMNIIGRMFKEKKIWGE